MKLLCNNKNSVDSSHWVLRTQFRCGQCTIHFVFHFRHLFGAVNWITSIVECNAGSGHTDRIRNSFIQIEKYWFQFIGENDAETKKDKLKTPAWRWWNQVEDEINISIDLFSLASDFRRFALFILFILWIFFVVQNRRLFSLNLLWKWLTIVVEAELPVNKARMALRSPEDASINYDSVFYCEKIENEDLFATVNAGQENNFVRAANVRSLLCLAIIVLNGNNYVFKDLEKIVKICSEKKMMESEQWMIRCVQPYVTTTAERVKEIAFKKKTATKTLLQCHSPARIHAMDESKSEIRFLSDSAVCSLLRQYLVWLLQRVTRRSGFIHSLRSRDFIIST